MPRHINIAYTPHLTLLYCGRTNLQSWWAETNVKVPYWRLYWNNRAGACLRAPDNAACHSLGPGHFTVVAPNTTLTRELQRPAEHFFTHFTVGPPYEHIHNCVYRCPAPPMLVKAMRRDYTATHVDTPAEDRPRRSATAMTLCWFALSALPPRLLPPESTDARLNKLLHWWESRQWQSLPNRELAAQVGMHPTAFCRYFHRVLGMPPHTFGLVKRIERACLLLHFSALSIAQIAEATGFCDRYYFTRQFSELRGVSPATFRRQGFLPENPAAGVRRTSRAGGDFTCG